MSFPRIIQGGMGVAVSAWPLANAVSRRGQLGVISGTGLDAVLARRLQLGDVGGHLADALAHFPMKEAAERIWDRYFVPGGKAEDAPFKSKPVPSVTPSAALLELTVAANFVEVWLAKRGHSGLVGINLLEKIQLPTLPSLYGAMLAGVDVVLMGAGIPRAIPGILERFSRGQEATMAVDVTSGEATVRFDPAQFLPGELPRPKFFGIVASASLAQLLAKKCDPPADGFVVEGPTAGGHNAPPRGSLQLDPSGQPIYGDRDIPDWERFRDLGLPFWIAGSHGTAESLQAALELGAQGVQVGTGFAFCEESGLLPHIKAAVLKRSLEGKLQVYTDPKASPTGFPFKVLSMPGTLSEKPVVAERTRICDLGYLREAYQKPDGKLGFRCASEPHKDYYAKGGCADETEGRLCVCNGLMAAVGLGQHRHGIAEQVLLTAGDDVVNIGRYLKPGRSTYTANDVLDLLLGEETPPAS